jgi:hypothetical protein
LRADRRYGIFEGRFRKRHAGARRIFVMPRQGEIFGVRLHGDRHTKMIGPPPARLPATRVLKRLALRRGSGKAKQAGQETLESEKG